MSDRAMTRRRRSRLGVGFFVAFALVGLMAVPIAAQAAQPTVAAGTASSASGSSTVTLNGTVDTTGCQAVTSWHAEFGSLQPSNYFYSPDSQNPFQGSSVWQFLVADTPAQSVSTTIPTAGGPALTPGVLYFWRLVATVQSAGPSSGCTNGNIATSVACFKLGVGTVDCPQQVSATFTVVNKRGRRQDAYVNTVLPGQTGSDGYPTTADGQFTTTVTPGEVLHFTRTPDVSGSCAAPEGGSFPGYAYTVPDNPPSQVTIQLDNTTQSDSPESPVLSPAERWLVGKINDMRQAKGLARLVVSTTLDRVAYATAHDAATIKAATGKYPWPPAHCAAVGDDWGWPQLALGDRVFGGNDASTSSAAAALDHWTNTSATDKGVQARTGLTFNSGITDIGVADGGTAWVMFVGDCSTHTGTFLGRPIQPLPADVVARCELTSDKGDSSIQLPPDQTGAGGSTGGGSSTGQVTAQSLAGGLVAGLAGQSSGKVLKAGGVSVSFVAGGPGLANASCTASVHHRRVKLMGGASRIRRAGKARLHLRLTGGGRNLLGQAHRHHRSLKASCRVGFVPPHGKRGSKTKSVTLAP